MRKLPPHIVSYCVLAFGFALALIGFTILFNKVSDQATEVSKQAEQIKAQSAELRAGLISSCQKNGNPLRAVVRKQSRDAIKQAKHGLESGQDAKFFPDIPPKQLQHLVEKQIKIQQGYIDSIPPVHCVAVYTTKNGDNGD